MNLLPTVRGTSHRSGYPQALNISNGRFIPLCRNMQNRCTQERRVLGGADGAGNGGGVLTHAVAHLLPPRVGGRSGGQPANARPVLRPLRRTVPPENCRWPPRPSAVFGGARSPTAGDQILRGRRTDYPTPLKPWRSSTPDLPDYLEIRNDSTPSAPAFKLRG